MTTLEEKFDKIIKSWKPIKDSYYDSGYYLILEFDHVHFSAKIEGSNLTKVETKRVIKTGKMIKGKKEWSRAVLNLSEAYNHIFKTKYTPKTMDKRFVLNIHRKITDGLIPTAGKFRKVDVYVGMYPTMDYKKVVKSMDGLINMSHTIKGLSWNNFKKIINWHLDFEIIHPFEDGNGRTGRLLTNWMLYQSGFPIFTFKYGKKSDYYAGFRLREKRHKLPDYIYFYYLKQLRDEVNNAVEKMGHYYLESDTMSMVEKFIDKNSGEFKKKKLWENLPKKVMYQTYCIIMDYLEESNKIAYDKNGYVVWIYNPELFEKYHNRKDLMWRKK